MSHVQTASQWRASVKGKPGDADADRAYMILRVYHTKPVPDVAGRTSLLAELSGVCKAYVGSHAAGSPLYFLFVNLGMQADKEIAMISKVQASYGKVRQIFLSKSTLGKTTGKTNTLQNRTNHLAQPSSRGNYWLEGLDPKHRSFGHEQDAETWFTGWMADAGTTLNFFDWLESKNLARGMEQVQYLDPQERWKYMAVFGDDKIMYRHQPHLGMARGARSIPLERFTTYGLETAHSGRNYAIWVCSPGGIFYTNMHAVSKFHHSTFLAGGRVLAAGEWVVTAGKVLLISHKTGHHGATPQMLFNALQLLNQRLDLSRTVVLAQDFTTHRTTYHTVPAFMAAGGVPAAAAQIVDARGVPILDIDKTAAYRCDLHRDWDDRFATAPRSIDASGALAGMPTSRPGRPASPP